LLLVEAPSASGRGRLSRFARFAWFVLAYNLAVVMWGAYVRATGSGGGCGSHWPLCNGVALPHSPTLATIIEFTHRLSSTLAGFFILALVVWAFRVFTKKQPVRIGALLKTFLVLTEGAIGAGLVLFEKTAQDKSAARVVSLSVHLINTFLLVACIALTAWWASGGKVLRWKQSGTVRGLVLIGLAGTLVLGVSGAITALGDTLYPVQSLAEGLRADLSPAAPFIVQFRKYHPALAILVGGYLMVFAISRITRAQSDAIRVFGFALTGLIVAQWVLGALDVLLLAPYWIQLIHLFLADLLWIAAVLLSANLLSEHANS
jgi:heme A synthase